MLLSPDRFIPTLPPYLFSLLTLPLLASMSIFVLMRRPREPLSWVFTGVLISLFVFFLGDVMQYQRSISVQTSLIWQYIESLGANGTVLSGLALILVLRNRTLRRWEWVFFVFIALRVIFDMLWLGTFVRPKIIQSCVNTLGMPRLTCPPADRWSQFFFALTGLAVIALFVSTAFKVTGPRRPIVRRYLVWAAIIVALNSVIWQVFVVITERSNSLLWTGVAVLMALIVLMRMFLVLEEMETGMSFPSLGWRGLLWLSGLLLAVFTDLLWTNMEAPMLTMIMLAAGMAAGGTVLVNALFRQTVKSAVPAATSASVPSVEHSAVVESSAAPEPPGAPTVTADPYALRVYLFGPMRVVRQGEILSNTAEVWRSGKTRSLLALLALRHHNGVTSFDIAEALWPIGGEIDSDADRKSQSAMRSYLSTLRRVLDPAGQRGGRSHIVRDGERYYLRSEDLWVDLWEFEALVEQAEKLAAHNAPAEALTCWQQAVALCSSEGLLPDEMNLPAEIIEPARQYVQRCWLKGLRTQARVEPVAERAVAMWENINHAQPFDSEALRWLIAYYQASGDRRKLLELLARRPDK